MTKARVLRWACVLMVCTAAIASGLIAQESTRPLSAERLLALVAGNALPENVMALLETHRLGFTPSEEFRKQLRQAGATADELKALSKAKIEVDKEGSDTKNAEVWAHRNCPELS